MRLELGNLALYIGRRMDKIKGRNHIECRVTVLAAAVAGSHFRFSDINTLRGLESVAWRICCGLPCQMGCHCLTCVPVHKSCGPAVADRCRAGVGPMLQASGRFRPCCDVLRHAHWGMEANDRILLTALVTWYFWRHFMLVVVSALVAN